uniref:Probable lipid II flippase MurJ n=1 Tax=candidate division WOR-3 bacterium TaxID=2052148 RepID=A0A7C4TC71_UNCW3
MADITKGVRAFTLGTALSRVFGLLREIVFAFLYGASTSTDAFQAAFRILDLLRDLFAETTLSSAIVPILTDQKQKGKQKQNLLASNIFNILLIIVGIVTILGMFFSPYIVNIIAFGFGRVPNKLTLTAQLATIIFPFLLFLALAAWAMSYLNTEGEFFVPSVAPAFFNLFSIIVPLILYSYLLNRGTDPIFGMAFGVLVGGLMQFGIQIPSLYKRGFRYNRYINFLDPEFKRVLALFIPVAIGLAGSRINVMVDTIMVSVLEEKSMTWLHYAFRIMHLPMGLFGIAVGTVALPVLSRLVVENNLSELRRTLFDSIKLVLFLTVSSSIIIAFFSIPITRIVYERGKFTSFDTTASAGALVFYIMGVPFAACLRNIAALFYAFKDAKTPMLVSLFSVGINVVLNYILMQIMSYRGIALATSLSAFINFAILLKFLPSKIGSFEISNFLKYFISLVISSTGGGFLGIFVTNFILGQFGSSILMQISALIIGGLISVFVFYYICLILKVREVRIYTRRLLAREN